MSGFDGGEVVMVLDRNGGHPEPPLDESWTDLDKLRWLAALVSYKTGLRITVRPVEQQKRVRGKWRPAPHLPSLYGVNVGSCGTSGRPFHSAWTLLNGVDIGAEQAARRLAGQ